MPPRIRQTVSPPALGRIEALEAAANADHLSTVTSIACGGFQETTTPPKTRPGLFPNSMNPSRPRRVG